MMNLFRMSMTAVVAAGFFLAACSPGDPASEVGFEAAWVRPVPPGMSMTAGFGTLHNKGNSPLVLSKFSSPLFGDVSLHRTVQEDGVSKMLEVTEISVAAGERLLMEPGSYHLMLMMPASDVLAGQMVPIEMTTTDGRHFQFEVPVERR